MKKLFLHIVFALAAFHAQAQDYTCDSLFLKIVHPAGSPYFSIRQPHSIMASDGSVLTCIPTKTLMNMKVVDFGDWLYRIDPLNQTVLDSAFVETDYTMVEDNARPLLANAPDGNGYILAKLIHNKLSYPGFSGKTWLRISRIDNGLNMQSHDEAVKVLLEDSKTINNLIGIKLEGEQIVLAYKRNARTQVMARVGLDGTVHEQTAFDNLFLLDDVEHGLAVFNDTPHEYSLSDWTTDDGETCLVYHVFDSLFTLKETIVMEGHHGDIYPAHPGYSSSPMPLDDGTFVQQFKYEQHNITRNGACLQKYDKATHQFLAQALFESWPFYLDHEKMGYPIGMVKTVNDNIYFAYRTNNNITGGSATTKGWLGFAKLDSDLNILWQRYCLGSVSSTGGYLHNYCHVSQAADGFAIIGGIEKEGEDCNFFYYFIHDEDPAGISEADTFIRPYMYYPNPAQDQLHLQYSPDVQPRQVELYDLQGRLVRVQQSDLEHVDLQGLSVGQYLMKVTLEDGKTFSDKVVKE